MHVLAYFLRYLHRIGSLISVLSLVTRRVIWLC